MHIGPAWGTRIAGPGVTIHNLLAGLLTSNDHNQYLPRMGMVDPTEVTTSFINATRTFVVAPTGASWRLHMAGVEYVKTTESVQITDTEGLWVFYYDENQVLQASQTAPDLLGVAYVGWVYWDAANNLAIYDGYEHHGLSYPAAVHRQMHLTVHTTYEADGGLAITDLTLGSGALDVDAQCGVSDGQIFDEDIRIPIRNAAVPADIFEQVLAAPAQLPGFYKWGAAGNWRRKAADNFPCLQAAFTLVGTRLSFNDPTGPWDFAEVANGGHVASWIIATNNRNAPVIWVAGQRQDISFSDADINNTFNSLDLTGLPFQEMVPIARLLFQTSNGYANSIDARIVDYQDLRGTTNIRGPSYVPVNHSSLSELNRDDHRHYLLGGDGVIDAVLNANQNNYNPAGLQTAQLIRLNTIGMNITITGITAPDGTYREQNKILMLVNIDPTYTFTLTDEDAASTNVNRMNFGGNDYLLGPGQGCVLIYDSDNDRWRCVGRNREIHYIKLVHSVASGTGGGNSVAGAWRTRTLNVEEVDTGGHAALAANQITLQPGTYIGRIYGVGFRTDGLKNRLRNITDGATTINGSSEYDTAASTSAVASIGLDRFTITAAKVFEFQYWVNNAFAVNGLGVPVTSGENEIHGIVEFLKVA